jgi:ketosteroid isomerase-like protein
MRTLLLLTLLATPAAAQAPIDFSKVQATRDSFVVLVQGTGRGYEIMSVERAEDGITVRDETNLMPVMKQDTEVRLAPDGSLRTVRQTGTVQGKEMKIDVRYLNGRATGTATTPNQAGTVETKAVSADVPAGVLDDNVVVPLLVGAPWGPGATFSLPVFASGQNRLQTVTLKVVGTEKVSVPLGTFDAYKVEMTGTAAPVTLYVKVEAPHRVVRIVPVGAPLEFVAAR